MSALVITTFPSTTETIGRRRALPWSLFVDGLREAGAQPFAGEKSHVGWSAATFAAERRLGANVKRLHAAVLDFDDASVDAVVALLAGTRAVVHTTRRHTPEAPRCRAVVPYTRPISPDEHARIWQTMAAHARAAGLEIDPQTKDPGHFFFAPGSLHGCFELAQLDGETLIPDLLLAAADPVTRAPSAPAPSPAPVGDRGELLARAARHVEGLPPAISGEGGHAATFKAALALVRGFNLTPDEARPIMDSYNNRCEPPWSSRELDHKIDSAAASTKTPEGFMLRDAAAVAASFFGAPEKQDPPGGGAPLLAEAADFFAGDEAEDDKPEPMAIDRLAPLEALTLFLGQPKDGKTTLLERMGLDVAAGLPFLGRFATMQGPVCLYLEEDSERRARSTFRALARASGLDPRALPLRIAVKKRIELDDEACVERLIEECQGARLIGIDGLSRVHSADENSRSEMAKVMRALSLIASRTKAAVVVVHHLRKPIPGNKADSERAGLRARGSSILYAEARSIVSVEKRQGVTRLHVDGNYVDGDAPGISLKVEHLEEGGKRVIRMTPVSIFDGVTQPSAAQANAAQRCAEEEAVVLEALAKGDAGTRQLRGLVKGRLGVVAIEDALVRLEMAGKVSRTGKPAPRSNTPTWHLEAANG